ncbi:GNAT family N-acetyltransferase [Pullulanibacillus sp. KACC 23026]|uniref:GNAT family N-acetyltransferase n=1 Tax=Pullulanibacillus sp. KACC 23026 TaxID=3028315 RepID=UPI0023B01B7F|nr:GNAT family N-acetyltransferase [Pullulanibacillus sp. KACC 23026]WEG12950.1 GNAT family N-acetyltransferase [Pullulanibacillus sp. KACC 23026]
MITIKPLKELTFTEALDTWNKGFEGYLYNQKMALDYFIQRFGTEELSPELSLVAFQDHQPIGILLNGQRTINGLKVAWNGGTGVALEHRHQGVGKALMDAAIALYKEHNIEIATLEAASSNIKAINLYKQYGYSVMDTLVFLENKEALSKDILGQPTRSYNAQNRLAIEASRISIINDDVPWQTQWQSLRKDGELLIISDSSGEAGYFLYKKQYNSEGQLSAIALFSAGIAPSRSDAYEIALFGLKELFQPLDLAIRRFTFNFRSNNTEIVSILNELGFKSFTEQIYMKKILK